MSYDLWVRARADGESLDETRATDAIAAVADRDRIELDVEKGAVRVGVTLPDVEARGERAVAVALGLAEALDGRVFDAQRDRYLDAAGAAETIAHQRRWKATAKVAVGAMLAEKMAERGLVVDGWYVPDRSGQLRELMKTPPPRAWGPGRQLARDLRGAGALVWPPVFIGLVAGAWLRNPYILVVVAIMLWLFIPSLVGMTRLLRQGTIVHVVVKEVTRVPAMKDRCIARFEFSTGGLPRRGQVILPAALVLTMLSLHGALELRLLVHERSAAYTQLLGFRPAPTGA
ncbi:MAG TPA: hypothetical protein VN947_15605 [Polyangia bacterium]|nr:hypothetical protein [Polyangia bacterium]